MDTIEREELRKRLEEVRFINIDARITALENEFISYVESEPKSSDQWMEARLRALEAQVKQLMERL